MWVACAHFAISLKQFYVFDVLGVVTLFDCFVISHNQNVASQPAGWQVCAFAWIKYYWKIAPLQMKGFN